MYLCEECRMSDGVVYIEGIVLCGDCFTDVFGVSWDSVAKSAAYCPSCESRVAGRHRCEAVSVEADKFLSSLKVKEE